MSENQNESVKAQTGTGSSYVYMTITVEMKEFQKGPAIFSLGMAAILYKVDFKI